jgi:hypothetical protein
MRRFIFAFMTWGILAQFTLSSATLATARLRDSRTQFFCDISDPHAAACSLGGFDFPQGHATANADYGSLTVAVETAGNRTNAGPVVDASASFSDILTITGGSGEGSILYSVTTVGITFAHNCFGQINILGHDENLICDGAFHYLISVPFQFGVPFSISAAVSTGLSANPNEGVSEQLSIIFVDSTVTDSNGNSSPDYRILSAANGDPMATPEPSTAIPVLIAGILFGIRKFR